MGKKIRKALNKVHSKILEETIQESIVDALKVFAADAQKISRLNRKVSDPNEWKFHNIVNFA